MFSTVAPVSQLVDVGVNIGQTMLEVARLLPKIEYFGFEPHIEALCCAKEIANTCKINAYFYPWACSSESAPRKLELEHILNDMRYKIYRIELSAQDREEFRGLKHITSF